MVTFALFPNAVTYHVDIDAFPLIRYELFSLDDPMSFDIVILALLQALDALDFTRSSMPRMNCAFSSVLQCDVISFVMPRRVIDNAHMAIVSLFSWIRPDKSRLLSLLVNSISW